MTGSAEVAAGAMEACGAALAEIGFKKRSGQLFASDLTRDISGFLGLNTAGNRLGEPFEINPVIGVRHQKIERIVAELTGSKARRDSPPTVSTPLGYLMPESRYRAWFFDAVGSHDQTAKSLKDAVKDYGLPYIHQHDSLESIVNELTSKKHADGDQSAMRVAVGLALLGDRGSARQVVDHELNELEGRQDMAATYYRTFADALLASDYV